MWKYAVILIAIGTIQGQITDNSYKIVNIKQGLVRGHLVLEGGVYGFYDIPYATAPTGINRFKAPQAPAVWMHTFDAIDRHIVCPQSGQYIPTFVNIQEDCLVASVFVPDTNQTNLPVFIHVHGGGYQYTYGNYISFNDFVRTSNVIVVTFNFRLGAHGFLCLGTEGAPGNAGLKDQVALLRWVNSNIASFGGNPDDVTLQGCSAGSGAIDMLILSRLTHGLVHKASLESGAAIGGTGVQGEPIYNAQRYARSLNFSNFEDLEALEEFYRTIPIQELYSQSGITGNPDLRILFGPCVERDVGEEIVLEDAPINILRQGNYNKIPLLYGYTDKDGLAAMPSFEIWKDLMNENFADYLSSELYFESEEDKNRVAERVKQFYFGDAPVSENTILSYIDYNTDVLFSYSVLQATKNRIKYQNETVYLFEYSFFDENTPNIPYTDEKGAEHCTLMFALADENESDITEEYRRMKAIVREYWTNFISSGVPSVQNDTLPVWVPTTERRTPYMSIGRTIELRNTILLEHRGALWDSIYEEHYRAPSAPQPLPGAAGPIMTSKLLTALILVLGMFFK